MDFVFKDDLGHSDAALRGRIEQELIVNLDSSEKDLAAALDQVDKKVVHLPDHFEYSKAA
jgi:hypothetical protein